jgi:hypothetical protein
MIQNFGQTLGTDPKTIPSWGILTNLASHSISMMRELIGSPVSVGYAHRSGGVGSERGEGVGWWNVIFDYEGFKAHYEVCPSSLLCYSLLLPLRLALLLSLLPFHLLILLYQGEFCRGERQMISAWKSMLMSRWESIRFHCSMPISRFIPMMRGSRFNMIRTSSSSPLTATSDHRTNTQAIYQRTPHNHYHPIPPSFRRILLPNHPTDI